MYPCKVWFSKCQAELVHICIPPESLSGLAQTWLLGSGLGTWLLQRKSWLCLVVRKNDLHAIAPREVPHCECQD